MKLVAAFEPFERRRRNRALDAARLVDPATATLPTAFARIAAAIGSLMAARPSALLLVGESDLTRHLVVERIALNLADARIPDNDGHQPKATPLVDGAPLALAVTVDPAALAATARAVGVTAGVSAHAGTFVCNAALYHALHIGGATRIAFVHVPRSWPWARDGRTARGLRAILGAL